MKRLKTTEVKKFREDMLADQHNICCLCEHTITDGEAVLDHNHRTGLVRGVLHRNCNLFLGKIENNIPRNKITEKMLSTILLNIQRYIRDSTEVYHPTFKTPEEKKALQAKRRKRKKNGKT